MKTSLIFLYIGTAMVFVGIAMNILAKQDTLLIIGFIYMVGAAIVQNQEKALEKPCEHKKGGKER